MISLQKILTEQESVQNNLRQRDPTISLDLISSLAKTKKALQTQYESIRQEINEISDNLSRQDKTSDYFTQIKIKSKELRDLSKTLKNELNEISEKLNEELLSIPNIILPDVPVSSKKEDKNIVYTFKTMPTFDFTPLDHVTLCERLKILDFKRATKIAETGFPLYRGKGAILEWALINYMMDNAVNKGFELIIPPLLNNTQSLVTTGNLPKFKEEIYSCQRDDLHLIPTAETPLTNIYRDEILNAEDLPLRLAAYTPCFRREAGSAGKLTKGLMRIHQFNKIETYSICLPSQAKSEHNLLIENGMEILQNLGLHFRLANLPSCDLAQQSAQTFDIEIGLPFLNDYSEVSSASNCLDYQSRRANIKFNLNGTKDFTYTLNCSALATPRIMIALLETNQTKDGHIIIPNALLKYTKFDKI